jgi:glycosyltransferase involved in cell wall biosynthesis
MPSPIVSVIIPAFNAEQFIGDAIESCLNQTFNNLEIVVIDDASVDCTAGVVQAMTDSRVRLHRMEKNAGPGACRNLGLKVARGKWITFLDADDCYASARLEILRDLAEQIGPDHVYSDDWVRWLGTGTPPDAMLECRPASIEISRWDLASWLESNREARILFHRSALNLLDNWFPDTRAGQDLVFTSRLLKVLGTPLVKASARTYIYRNTQGSITKSTSRLPGALEIQKSYRIICDEVLEGRHPARVLHQSSLDDVKLKRLKEAIGQRDVVAAVRMVARRPGLIRIVFARALKRIQNLLQ